MTKRRNRGRTRTGGRRRKDPKKKQAALKAWDNRYRNAGFMDIGGGLAEFIDTVSMAKNALQIFRGTLKVMMPRVYRKSPLKLLDKIR